MKNPAGLKLFTVLCLTVLLSACYDMTTSEIKAEPQASDKRVVSVYLVTVSAQHTQQEIETLFAQYGVSELKQIDSQLYRLTLTRDPGLQPLQGLAKQSPIIRHIQPNNIYRKN